VNSDGASLDPQVSAAAAAGSISTIAISVARLDWLYSHEYSYCSVVVYNSISRLQLALQMLI